jgi:alpha,alpha-trehalose phosphorylase
VTIRNATATYELLDGPPITITHHGESVELKSKPLRKNIPPAPRLTRPTQPPGREPRRRALPIDSQQHHAAS